MKTIFININKKHLPSIISGKQKIIVMNTKPQFETPFKVYISKMNQKNEIIGEFICEKFNTFFGRYDDHGSADLTPSKIIYGLGNANQEDEYLDRCCLTHEELFDYIMQTRLGIGYGYYISRLKIYDKPQLRKENE